MVTVLKLFVNSVLLTNVCSRRILSQNYCTLRPLVNKKSGSLLLKEKEKEINDALKLEMVKNQTSLDWREFRRKLLTQELRGFDVYITEKNIDSVIMRLCRDYKMFDTGQSFYKYLKEINAQLSNGFLSQYLHLCSLNRKFAGENKEELIKIYKQLTNAEILEPLVAERCITLVCMFESHWKDSFYLLEQVKGLSEPTPLSYNSVIEACFKFGDVKRGWDLMRHLVQETGTKPKPECYLAYIDYCVRSSDANTSIKLVEDLFTFLEEYHLNIASVEVVNMLEKYIFSMSDSNFKWSLKETYIPKNGACANCRRCLEPVNISSEDFQILSKTFASQVLIGGNVFLKSTPEEILSFKRFVEKMNPCDIVIDGLNTGYATGNKTPHVMSKTLRSVVDHFLRKRFKIVILGRLHMKYWPGMNYFYENCKVFLATNLSHDDPLLLYAALRGGEKTCFISRDLMRSHTFLIEDPAQKRLFRKWLVSHQYFLGFFDKRGVPNILPPLPYQPTAQKLPLTNGEICWHIPFDTEYKILPPNKREPPPKWLCIQRLPR